ncbi:hypothetical protein GCM10010415_12930 [Streptomyces atrovirens]
MGFPYVATGRGLYNNAGSAITPTDNPGIRDGSDSVSPPRKVSAEPARRDSPPLTTPGASDVNRG